MFNRSTIYRIGGGSVLKDLTGEYEHSVDQKGRLFIPAKLREILGEQFRIFKGLDECIFVYSLENWEKYDTVIKALPLAKSRQIKRVLYPTLQQCEPDGQGRILISQKLRDYAKIDKNVTIVGVGDHAEIWASDKWCEEYENLTGEVLAEAMDLLGV